MQHTPTRCAAATATPAEAGHASATWEEVPTLEILMFAGKIQATFREPGAICPADIERLADELRELFASHTGRAEEADRPNVVRYKRPLKRMVLDYERQIIRHALRESAGSVSRAAERLGFKHYQTLIALLNKRHRELLPERSPIIPRRRSIIPKDKQKRPKPPGKYAGKVFRQSDIPAMRARLGFESEAEVERHIYKHGGTFADELAG